MAQPAETIKTAVFETEITPVVKKTAAPELTLVEAKAEPRANTSLHAGAFKALAFLNAGVLAVFWLTFQSDGEALFMVAISAVYLAAYLGTPFLLSRIGGYIDPVQEKPFAQFLEEPFETWTGVVSGREAVLQILLVPAAILIAVAGMSVIIGMNQ